MMNLKDFKTENELDFNKKVKIEDIAFETVKIVNKGIFSTKFGKKNYIILEDGRWTFLTQSLEKLMVMTLPIKVKIEDKISKSGNTYWGFEIMYDDNSASLKDFVNKEIVIKHVEPITTKYGERVKMTIEYDNIEYKVIGNCTFVLNIADKINNTDGVVCRVVEKTSKAGYVYYTVE